MKINTGKWRVTIVFACIILGLCSCGNADKTDGQYESAGSSEQTSSQQEIFENMHWEAGEKPAYAECFQIDKCGDFELITIVDSGRFLLVSGESEIPEDVPEDVTILRKPLENVYLAASSGFDFVRQLESLDKVAFAGTKEQDLYIQEAVDAMQAGQICYAGKYSAPDYEMLINGGCNLAIESTMIYHSPATKEKLEALNIPVLVERSSYETHPLGRLEWIKLYGALFGKEEAAKEYYDRVLAEVEPVMAQEKTESKVAFFYVNANGVINVRKSGDYIAKMVSLSGGNYVPQANADEEENALSTMNMQMEDFYLAAKDADILIYNGTITGALERTEELIEKNELFADFKAVKENRVYCTGKNVFQETTAIGDLMEDIGAVIHGTEKKDLKQLTKLK